MIDLFFSSRGAGRHSVPAGANNARLGARLLGAAGEGTVSRLLCAARAAQEGVRTDVGEAVRQTGPWLRTPSLAL